VKCGMYLVAISEYGNDGDMEEVDWRSRNTECHVDRRKLVKWESFRKSLALTFIWILLRPSVSSY